MPSGQAVREREAGGERRGATTASRHATFFLELAERAYPELRGERQGEWLAKLEHENGNLRAAMGWAVSAGEAETASRLGWALWLFWWLRGHQREGRRWMEMLLEQDFPADLRAIESAVAGIMAYTQGDYEASRMYLEESLELARNETITPTDYARTSSALALTQDTRCESRLEGLSLLIERGDAPLQTRAKPTWRAAARTGRPEKQLRDEESLALASSGQTGHHDALYTIARREQAAKHDCSPQVAEG